MNTLLQQIFNYQVSKKAEKSVQFRFWDKIPEESILILDMHKFHKIWHGISQK